MKRKRMSYTAQFKLKVVALAESSNNCHAGRECGVSEKVIRDWRRAKAQLQEMPRSKRANRGSSARCPELEEALNTWVEEHRLQGRAVSRLAVRIKAREMARTGDYPTTPTFQASPGWCNRFFKRYHLSVRRRTKISQKLPQDLEEKITDFHRYIIKQRKQTPYELAHILNMDETPMCFDMPSATTVNKTGAKEVFIRTTGNEKNHFTVVLACAADGTKLPPMVIFKRKTLPKGDVFPRGVIVHAQEKGWMDQDGMLLWFKRVLQRRSGSLLRKPALLVWDSFRAHLTEPVTTALQRDHQTIPALIPGGLTSILQPLDVCLNKPFKDKVRHLWQSWMFSGDVETTARGNLKRASLQQVCQWVLAAWDDIPAAMVSKAFLKCGISNAMDGSQDDILWEEDPTEEDTVEEDLETQDYTADDVQCTEEEWLQLFGASDDEESDFEGF